jgi:hypothetical protein
MMAWRNTGGIREAIRRLLDHALAAEGIGQAKTSTASRSMPEIQEAHVALERALAALRRLAVSSLPKPRKGPK